MYRKNFIADYLQHRLHAESPRSSALRLVNQRFATTSRKRHIHICCTPKCVLTPQVFRNALNLLAKKTINTLGTDNEMKEGIV